MEDQVEGAAAPFILPPDKSQKDNTFSKPTAQDKDINDGVLFCFSINQSIYHPDNFIINSSLSNLNHEVIRFDNITILRVYCGGLINMAMSLFVNKYNFTISYKDNKGNDIYLSSNEFYAEKNKIKVVFDAAKKGTISSNYSSNFKNPDSLAQYEAFNKVLKGKEFLLSETIEYLTNVLDIELFLYLLETKEEKHSAILGIFDNYPYLKIIYQKNKPLRKIKFESLTSYKNYKKLITIYSIIEDSTNLLNEFKEDDLNIFFQYMETQKDDPLYIKKNIFKFFINKTKNIQSIKKICKSCESIPLLFDNLLELPADKINEIKNLLIEDIPQNFSFEDNLIDLVEKYEKIKVIFAENEIIKLWKKYLNLWYKKKTIPDLEEIRDKFSTINRNFYTTIIDEINDEILNKGKKMILNKEFSNLEMFKFINKYNSEGDFFSDDHLLAVIGKNLNLKELDSNPEILKEFNECKFYKRIDPSKIVGYIAGTLSIVINFDEFYLYFKYIFELKEKEPENEEKNSKFAYHIISHFMYLLDNLNAIKLNEHFNEIFQKVILLSLMYIEDTKKRNYIEVITHLSNCHSFSNDDIIKK